MGIKVLPPNIQKSELEFSVAEVNGESCILFGLGAIKGAGEVAINIILDERKNSGDFKDLEDFLGRIDPQKVNKKALESFIKSGAMDDFNYTRKSLLEQIESLTEAAKAAQNAKKEAENSLFGNDEELVGVNLNLEHYEEFSQKEILEFEKESLGFYASGHPLDSYKEIFKSIQCTSTNQIKDIAENSRILIAGKIEDIIKKFSKNGKPYGILKLQDLYGSVELTIFEQTLKQLDNIEDKEKPIAVKCLVQEQDETKKLKAEKVLTLEDAKKEKVDFVIQKADTSEPLMLVLDFHTDTDILRLLKEAALRHQGKRELRILFRTQTQELEMISALCVHSEIKEEFKQLQWQN